MKNCYGLLVAVMATAVVSAQLPAGTGPFKGRLTITVFHSGRDTPLVPYLCLFVAERLRYAFEFLNEERNPTQAAAVAARYRSYIARARRADPIVALAADDLDGLPFLYRDVGKHPGDF